MDATHVQKIVNAISKDKLAVADLVFFNNPTQLVASLRHYGHTDMVAPNEAAIGNVFKRLLYRRDFTTVRQILGLVQFNPDARNFTTDKDLWSALGVTYGSFTELANKYI